MNNGSLVIFDEDDLQVNFKVLLILRNYDVSVKESFLNHRENY